METQKDKHNGLRVGMKLYRDYYHRNKPTEIYEYEIKKIGREYFYLSGPDTYHQLAKAKISDLIWETWNSRYQLYRSKQEIEDKNLRIAICGKIKEKAFPQYGQSQISLEQAKQIADILGIEY